MRIQPITPTIQNNTNKITRNNINRNVNVNNTTQPQVQKAPSFKGGMSSVKILSLSALFFSGAGIASVYAPPLAIMLCIPGGLALFASLGQAEIERQNGEGN